VTTLSEAKEQATLPPVPEVAEKEYACIAKLAMASGSDAAVTVVGSDSALEQAPTGRQVQYAKE
jgi:hypothetical protein